MVNLGLKQSQPEVSIRIDKNPLLFHLRFLAMKDLHIELYKILKNSKKNTGNIFQVLKSFIESNPLNKGTAILNLQNLEKHQSAIENICNRRDKFYAHLDDDFENYIHKPVYTREIENCFEIIKNTITTLTSLDKLNSIIEEIPLRNELSVNS